MRGYGLDSKRLLFRSAKGSILKRLGVEVGLVALACGSRFQSSVFSLLCSRRDGRPTVLEPGFMHSRHESGQSDMYHGDLNGCQDSIGRLIILIGARGLAELISVTELICVATWHRSSNHTVHTTRSDRPGHSLRLCTILETGRLRLYLQLPSNYR